MESPDRARRLPAVLLGRLAIIGIPVAVLAGSEVVARLFHLEERASASLAIPQWIDADTLARKMPLARMEARPADLRLFYSAYRRDRFLGFRLKPGLRIPMVDILVDAWRDQLKWTLDSNASGYRGPEPRNPKPAASLRILCMGDSSTYGWGLESDDTYPVRLQRALDVRHGSGRFEVVNLGVPGYTTFQGWVLLQREALALRPDLVTVAFGANDDARVGVTERERYERACSWVGLLQDLLGRSQAYGALKGLILRWKQVGASARFREAGQRASTGRLDVSEDEYVSLLRDMVTTIEKRGAHAVLVGQCLSRRPGSRLDLMARLAREHSIAFLDIPSLPNGYSDRIEPDPVLRVLASRYERIYGQALAKKPHLNYLLPDKCHPNALLAEIVARELATIVEQELLAGSADTHDGEGRR